MASESFEPALICVLGHEGGYADHPDDPGGATMKGITRATLSAWRGQAVTKAEVRALTRREAGEIYRARYWDAVRGDELPAGVDLAVFDFAVNSGPGRAVRALQSVLAVPVDGVPGPETLLAARAAAPAPLIAALCAHRLGFLERLPAFAVFGRGWTRRVRDIERVSLRLREPDNPKNSILKNSNFKNSNFKNSNLKETTFMDFTKTILSSRTIWANTIGVLALVLSWFGFDTGSVDKSALTDNLLQVIAGVSFVASSVFRVLATRRLV